MVFDAVRELDGHATAEQIYEHVAKTHPSISKATVYRNLNHLSGAGELLNIGSFYGSTHYDYNCHNHYHFVCEECKRVFDVSAYIPDIGGELKSMQGFEVKSLSLSFNGTCRDCGDRGNDQWGC